MGGNPAVSVRVSPELTAQGISLTIVSAPGFRQELSSRIENFIEIQSVAGPIFDVSVAVTNTGKQPVSAVALRAEITDLQGRTRVQDEFAYDFDVSGGRLQIRENASRIITPDDALNNMLVGSLSTGQPVKIPLTLVTSALRNSDSLLKAQSVVITLDSVCLSNGVFLGPDKANTLRRLSAWFAAEEDLLKELTGRVSRGDTGPAIVDFLQSRLPKSGSVVSPDDYNERYRMLARPIARRFQSELPQQVLADYKQFLSSQLRAFRKF